MNYYVRTIEILETADNEQKLRRILYAIARERPSAIVFAVDGYKLAELEKRCLDLYQNVSMVEAIKLWRAETGVGLKEAKEAVEALVPARRGEG